MDGIAEGSSLVLAVGLSLEGDRLWLNIERVGFCWKICQQLFLNGGEK